MTDPDANMAYIFDLSGRQIDNLVRKIPSDDKRENYGSTTAIMVTVAKCKVNILVAEKVGPIYPERSQLVDQNQIEWTVVDMVRLDNIAASDQIKKASTRFLETILIGVFSREAANDIIS